MGKQQCYEHCTVLYCTCCSYVVCCMNTYAVFLVTFANLLILLAVNPLAAFSSASINYLKKITNFSRRGPQGKKQSWTRRQPQSMSTDK